MSYRAVIFDLGGVVFPSPLDVFRDYERRRGLPDRFLSRVVLADPERGAWSRLERGELDLGSFAAEFESECEAAGAAVDAAELMTAVGAGMEARPEMVAAIRRIRGHGLVTAALTNNWAAAPGDADAASAEASVAGPAAPGPFDLLGTLFDVIVESAVEGLRKPDPRIYELVCDRAGVEPARAVFLDDLGTNLKPARAMGMTTIKVGDPRAALDELSAVLGLALGGPEPDGPGRQGAPSGPGTPAAAAGRRRGPPEPGR